MSKNICKLLKVLIHFCSLRTTLTANFNISTNINALESNLIAIIITMELIYKVQLEINFDNNEKHNVINYNNNGNNN